MRRPLGEDEHAIIAAGEQDCPEEADHHSHARRSRWRQLLFVGVAVMVVVIHVYLFGY